MDEVIESGEVVAVEPGLVDVRVARTDACEQCSHCSKVDKDGMLITGVSNSIGASRGDIVEVEIPAGTDIRAGIYAYVLPVVALLLGYAVGFVLGQSLGWDPDLTGAVLGIAGAIGGMTYMRTGARKVLESERFRPKVRAIMAPARTLRPESAARE